MLEFLIILCICVCTCVRVVFLLVFFQSKKEPKKQKSQKYDFFLRINCLHKLFDSFFISGRFLFHCRQSTPNTQTPKNGNFKTSLSKCFHIIFHTTPACFGSVPSIRCFFALAAISFFASLSFYYFFVR